MTGWRHTERGWDKACGAPSDVPGFINCGCTTPTPDPASPCAECPPDDPERPWVYHRCARCREFTEFCRCARCTCGHPIEEMR